MSSGLFNPSERHELVGTLLRIRVAVYIAAGVPILLAPSVSADVRLAGVAILLLAIGAPYILRRNNRYAGLRFAATSDLLVSYGIWLMVPWATGISLFLALGAVAVVVFLSPTKSAKRIAALAIVLELSKIGVIVAGLVSPGAASPSEMTEIGILLARTFALGGSYLLFRTIDSYILRLSVAAETATERYRRLMDTAPTGYLVQVDSKVVYGNEAAGRLLHHRVTDLVGSSLVDLVASEDRPRLRDCMRNTIDRFETVSLENLSVDVAGPEECWVDIVCSVIHHGSDLAVQIALNDRSGQRKAEIDLDRTRDDYQELFERIPVALYRSLPDGTIMTANAALLELFGAETEADVVQFAASDLYVDVADREHLASLLEESDVVVGYEQRMCRLDGEKIWVRDTSRRIDTGNGVVYEGAMVDITHRRAIEDELWARAAQQEAAATIGQIALDSDDIVSVLGDITELVSHVLGTEGVVLLQRLAGGAFGLTGADTGLDLSPDAVSAVADRAHMTAAPVVLRTAAEVRFAAPDLADHGIESCAAVMIPGVDTDFGTLIAVATGERLFTADDINFLLSVANVLAAAIDRSAAQTRLQDLLKSKDAFVASVSHELRTPLTVVTGMAHELGERWMHLSDDELGEFTSMLVEQSRDMSDLIDDLLVAARSNIGNVTVRRVPVSLEREIESVLAGFTDTGESSIVVHTAPGNVTADPIRVRQILRNLITNALRYGGSNIEIVTTRGPGILAVEVIDDGAGILPEDHDRIFVAYERAHQSRGQPGSVGLGLTVSRTLAELMGGSLTYRSDDLSVFRLELPSLATDSVEAMSTSDARGDAMMQGIETVGARRLGVDVG
ncbi:MAG: ATP-binding protein [Acidimicrobiia bacterium]